MSATREIHTRTGRHWLGDDGIIGSVYLPGAEDTRADAVENVRAFETLASGRRTPILIDARVVASLSREARVHYASPESLRTVLAMAILVGSPVSRMIGNFFLTLNKPLVPIRLFTGEAEARAWLRGFLP